MTSQRPVHPPPALAVVGAGAAGTLTAIHLLRELRGRRSRAAVVLIDPAEQAGRGVAYSTTDERHLLNVRAGQLSALPDEPDHLVAWARRHVDPAVTGADFLPRRRYGDYLAHTLDAEADRSDGVRLQRLRARVVALEAAPPNGDRVHLSDGTTVPAAAVVLAPGVFAPGTAWAPPDLRTSPRFVPDPWAPGILERVARSAGDVLLVGTGLTMVDVTLAVHRQGKTVHAVSRRGRLPKAHTRHTGHGTPAVCPAALPGDADLDIAMLRRVVEDHVRATVRTHGDWRPAVDGLRAHTARLWSALCDGCRAEFLAKDAQRWDTHRHRMPQRTAAEVGRLRSTGELRVARGEVTGVDDDGRGLLVHLSDGARRRVSHVVNCTGPQADITQAGDPLLTGLVADGRAAPGPLRMGLATDRDGRVRAADGSVGSLWTLGAMRRGELWESTAVPEIRAQALVIAGRLASATTPERPMPARRTPRDVMGLPLSTSAAAAEAYQPGPRARAPRPGRGGGGVPRAGQPRSRVRPRTRHPRVARSRRWRHRGCHRVPGRRARGQTRRRLPEVTAGCNVSLSPEGHWTPTGSGWKVRMTAWSSGPEVATERRRPWSM